MTRATTAVTRTVSRRLDRSDWTPSGGSAEVGPDSERLRIILEAAKQSAEVRMEEAFSTDMLERFKNYGNRKYVSEKQWASLDRLEANLRRQTS
jgi:hypothetical protein